MLSQKSMLSMLGQLLLVTGCVSPPPVSFLPDLAITSAYVSMVDANGSCLADYGFIVTVVNQGNTPAPGVVLLETNTGQQVQIGTLDAFQSITMPFVAKATSGAYTVVADPQNIIIESNENNNSATYFGSTATPPASCPPLQTIDATATPFPPALTPVPTEEQVVPTEAPYRLGGINTYHDDMVGFTLDYPAQWYIESDALQGAAESTQYTVTLFSWDRASTTPSKDLNTLPDGATKMDITVVNNSSETLADAVYQMRTQDGGTSVNFLREENWVLSNGQNAVYLESDGAYGVIGTMITRVNGRTIYLSGYGDLSLFKAIGLTLHSK